MRARSTAGNDSVPAGPFVDGAQYDRTRFRNRAARARFVVMERHVLGAVRGRGRVLDVGCGTGRFTVRLDAPERIGIDRSWGMLVEARRRGLVLARGDANALPFADASFDAVVATDSVFGMLDWSRALPECARVTCEGAVLALHVRTHAIWSPRVPFSLSHDPSVPSTHSGVALIEAAHAVGFRLASVRLWRWLRVFPYLVAVPPKPAWPTWNHGVFVFAARGRTAR